MSHESLATDDTVEPVVRAVATAASEPWAGGPWAGELWPSDAWADEDLSDVELPIDLSLAIDGD